MPDHLHLLVTPQRISCELGRWVKYWKSIVSKDAGIPQLWQKDFWDRRLRSDQSYYEKCEYIWNNPVRAGLVKNAKDWPYRGELNRFDV